MTENHSIFGNAVWLNVRTRPIDRLAHCRNPQQRRVPGFLRKISLKIACKLAIKIETVSCPCNTCFWYAVALAVRNTSLGCASWRISYCQRSSISKTRIAWQETVSIFIGWCDLNHIMFVCWICVLVWRVCRWLVHRICSLKVMASTLGWLGSLSRSDVG